LTKQVFKNSTGNFVPLQFLRDKSSAGETIDLRWFRKMVVAFLFIQYLIPVAYFSIVLPGKN
jgi:hypothetical protein